VICDELEKKIKAAENTASKKELDERISEIDFHYYTLKRFNGGILPWSNKKFQELNQKVEKIKNS